MKSLNGLGGSSSWRIVEALELAFFEAEAGLWVLNNLPEGELCCTSLLETLCPCLVELFASILNIDEGLFRRKESFLSLPKKALYEGFAEGVPLEKLLEIFGFGIWGTEQRTTLGRN